MDVLGVVSTNLRLDASRGRQTMPCYLTRHPGGRSSRWLLKISAYYHSPRNIRGQTVLEGFRERLISGSRGGSLLGAIGLRDPARRMTYMHEADIARQETKYSTLVRAAGGEIAHLICLLDE